MKLYCTWGIVLLKLTAESPSVVQPLCDSRATGTSTLSPTYSGKLNWTELTSAQLNSTRLFSSVEFSSVSFPLCIELATSCESRRRFSSNDWLIHESVPRLWKPATTASFVAESSQIVAGSMHSGKLNWTELFSWV